MGRVDDDDDDDVDDGGGGVKFAFIRQNFKFSHNPSKWGENCAKQIHELY